MYTILLLCNIVRSCASHGFEDSSTLLNLSEKNMLDFKPSSDDPGDLVESSDDLGANLIPDAEDGSDDSDDDDVSDEDVADIGEEAGKAEAIEENPFFAGSDDSDSDISDDSHDDDEEDGAVGGSKEPVDEEDELIKALKAAREKKTRNCPPDIKTQV